MIYSLDLPKVCKMSSLRAFIKETTIVLYQKQNNYQKKKFLFMLNLSPKELKAIAKIRGIKGYKSMPNDKLLSALKASQSEKNFDKTRIEKIREEL